MKVFNKFSVIFQVLELKTRDDEIIENFHMSSSNNFIAYITGTKLRVYNFEISSSSGGENNTDKKLPKIRRMDMSLKPNKIPNLVHFYRHNSVDFLLTATTGNYAEL